MLVTCDTLSPALHLVRCTGTTLDSAAFANLMTFSEQALAAGSKAVLIDLGAPARCSHAGIAVLVEVFSRLSSRLRIALCNLGVETAARLNDHGLNRVLPVFETVEAALNSPELRSLQLTGLRAIVLCAGTGSRMNPMTRYVPKPLLDVAGAPVLQHILTHLDRFGLRNVIMNPGYLGPQIPKYFEQVGHKHQNLFFVSEGHHTAEGWQAAPMGSMSTLAHLAARNFAFHDDTFVLCGDALIDIDFSRMLALHRRSGAAVTIAAQEVAPEMVENYGILVTDSDGRILEFKEKPKREEAQSRLANTGIYLFRPDALADLPLVDGQDIAKDLFPALMRAGLRLQSYAEPFSWVDIGCGRDYYRAVARVLQSELPLVKPEGKLVGSSVWLAPGAQVSPEAEITGPCHIGAGARIEAGARIVGTCAIGAGAVIESKTLVRDSIIWPKTRVADGAWVDQMIAGPDWAAVHHYADGRKKAFEGLDGLSTASAPEVPDAERFAS